MPNIMTDYEHLNSYDEPKLLQRQQTLKSAVPEGDWNKLSDEALQELLAIGRILRKRTTAPKATTSAKRAPVSLDSL